MIKGHIEYAEKQRSRAINVEEQRILVANFDEAEQSNDFSLRPNCDGFGRIHHFRRQRNPQWPENPLPIDAATKALSLPETDMMTAEVFQCAACNFQCWYCFVSPDLLCDRGSHAAWLTAEELIDIYSKEKNTPRIVVLSGGNPGLVPEWVVWMIKAIEARNMGSDIYLWSDDNLSTDFFWRYLSDSDVETVVNFRNHGKVGCFKGFSRDTFTFNTGVDGVLYEKQFEFMRRYLALGIDMHAYVTLTAPTIRNARNHISDFLDRLQGLDENLPLRTIPLEILPFTSTKQRLNEARTAAIRNQYEIIVFWQDEIEARYGRKSHSGRPPDIPCGSEHERE